ncbi:hypothetical protein Tco_0576027 [Tanacetum coccineum]
MYATISASKPKRKANKSVATPHKKTVASDTTIQKSKSYYKKLYENTNPEWRWWIAKRCPSAYTWTQKPLRTKKIWMPKVRKDDESTSISPTIDIVSRITNILQLILFIVDSGCTKMTFEQRSSSLGRQCQMVSAENNTSGPFRPRSSSNDSESKKNNRSKLEIKTTALNSQVQKLVPKFVPLSKQRQLPQDKSWNYDSSST